MKKLIYLSHWRFPSEKTMTPLIMRTCEQFKRFGYDVELWVPQRENPGFAQKDPFAVHHIETRFAVRRLFAIDLMRPLGALGFLILVVSFNVSALLRLLFYPRGSTILYAHDIRDILFLSWLGFPVYVEIHDFYESSLGWMNRLVLRHANGLIVTNTLKMRHLAEAYGYPTDRMIRQPNAVDYDLFHVDVSKDQARRKLNLPQGSPIALYTGHLFSWKGVDTLISASAELPPDVLVYLVGGTASDRAALLAAMPANARVTFVEHQDHARMPLFMRAADVLVLPNTAREAASRLETSPVKLFEYLSSGTPIVASDLPSIRDIVTDNEVRFFNPDDPHSLAEAILETLSQKEKANERAKAGAVLAQGLSWEARGRNIAGLIERTS